jgi:hypothetical protein
VIIILEGPDGAGKTILAHELCTRLHLGYHHEGPPPLHVEPLYHYGALLDAARYQRVVFDRLALGERVYGPLLRGHDRLGAEGWRVMRRLIVAVGAAEVLCLPPFHVVHDNWRAKHRQGHHELIHAPTLLYETWARFSQLSESHHYCYDYTQPEALTQLLNVLNHNRYQDAPLPRGMLGWPSAHYLLVGDKGSNARQLTDLPFFSVTSSAAYLTECLDRAGYAEEELAWVNARWADGTPNHETWPLPKRHVIALGRRAERECYARKLNYRTVPHPQFWRRFHRHTPNEYATRLREAR